MKTIKALLVCLALTFINYLIAYLLSSHEVIFDGKNLGLIFIFSCLWIYFSQDFRKNKSFIAIYILSCILGFTVPTLAYFSEPTFLQRLMKDFLFWYSFPLIPISIHKCFTVNKKTSLTLSYVATLLSLIALIPLFVIVLYYITFNTQISTDSILAILQTNKQEALEFLATYATIPKISIVILATIIFIILTFKLYNNLFNEFSKYYASALHNRKYFIVLTIIISISNIMFAGKTYIARSLDDALSRYKLINNFSLYSKQRVELLINDSSLKINQESGNFALIIGETHARSNMSAYGYQRQTTPWLQSAIKSNDVILLQNSFSNSGVTTSSLEYALTAKNQYNDFTFENAITLTEIAQANGFNVIWISNQVDDNIAGMIGHEANQQYWLNKNHNDTWLRQKNNLFDDKIVNCLESLPKQNKKTLFVIHLLGSHASYNCRYPDNFNKWNDNENQLNAYDNSVLYNDYIMSKIYQLLFEKFNVDGMMYFADHGEELKLKFCHGTEYFYNNYQKYPSVKEIVKIPVYFAFSNTYKQNNQEQIDALLTNSQKYFTNDMVYDTMLGIMHIKEPYYNAKYDITSAKYNMQLNNLKTIHGKVNISDCL